MEPEPVKNSEERQAPQPQNPSSLTRYVQTLQQSQAKVQNPSTKTINVK